MLFGSFHLIIVLFTINADTINQNNQNAFDLLLKPLKTVFDIDEEPTPFKDLIGDKPFDKPSETLQKRKIIFILDDSGSTTNSKMGQLIKPDWYDDVIEKSKAIIGESDGTSFFDDKTISMHDYCTAFVKKNLIELHYELNGSSDTKSKNEFRIYRMGDRTNLIFPETGLDWGQIAEKKHISNAIKRLKIKKKGDRNTNFSATMSLIKSILLEDNKPDDSYQHVIVLLSDMKHDMLNKIIEDNDLSIRNTEAIGKNEKKTINPLYIKDLRNLEKHIEELSKSNAKFRLITVKDNLNKRKVNHNYSVDVQAIFRQKIKDNERLTCISLDNSEPILPPLPFVANNRIIFNHSELKIVRQAKFDISLHRTGDITHYYIGLQNGSNINLFPNMKIGYQLIRKEKYPKTKFIVSGEGEILLEGVTAESILRLSYTGRVIPDVNTPYLTIKPVKNSVEYQIPIEFIKQLPTWSACWIFFFQCVFIFGLILIFVLFYIFLICEKDVLIQQSIKRKLLPSPKKN